MVDLATSLVSDVDPRSEVVRLRSQETPSGLGAHATSELQRVLTRGMARTIALGGGRLAPDQPMVFGSATLDLLSWLFAHPLAHPSRPPLALRSDPTPVEQLLLARAAELCRTAGVPVPEPALHAPWAWLWVGELLAPEHAIPDTLQIERVTDQRWLLEALQPALSRRWLRWCRAARADTEGPTIAHGEAQERLATNLVAALADTPDLAGFLFDLAPRLAALPEGVWEVERAGRATMWQRARRARVAIPRAIVEGLGAWGAVWSGTGFIDDGYRDAQRWLVRYSPSLGCLATLRRICGRAEELPEVS